MRGFVSIGLYNPKKNTNVGGALRACGCYGAASIHVQGERYKKSQEDTQKISRHIPVLNVQNLLETKPLGSKIVAVEFINSAINLQNFRHPESAFYIFGPEDGNIPTEVLDKADFIVYIPTRFCLNLSQAVSTILYDRHVKTNQIKI